MAYLYTLCIAPTAVHLLLSAYSALEEIIPIKVCFYLLMQTQWLFFLTTAEERFLF